MQVVAAGYGVWAYHYVHGDVTHALEVGQRLAETGHRRAEPTISGLAASLTGIAQTMAGDLQEARATMLKAQTVIPPGAAERLRAQVGFDLAQSTSCYLAWIELVSGAATQSRDRAAAVQTTILEGEEVNGRAFKLSHAGALASERGEIERMGEIGTEMLTLCEAHGLEFWKSFGHAFTGWRLLEQDRPAEAVPHLEIAYVEMKLRGGGLLGALMPGLMAEATARAGNARALEMIADAEAEAAATGRNFGRAETLRRHGRVLASLRPDAPDAAARLFRAAIDVAHGQGALLWEIRAACDLARLLDDLGQGAQGQAVLAPVLDRWRDPILPQELVAARALLDRIDA